MHRNIPCGFFLTDFASRFTAVVVLDEVGLAEDSPKMPLKALHPLLEDGCVGDKIPEPHMKVRLALFLFWNG